MDRSARPGAGRATFAGPAWMLALVACIVWVLAVDVFVAFPRVRARVVTAPLPPQQTVVLSLDAADSIPGNQLVAIVRIRNSGADNVTVSGSAANQALGTTVVRPHSTSRIDLVVDRSRGAAPPDSLQITGTTAAWQIESAELSNAHGFTAGAVEFLVLPRRQAYRTPPARALLLCIACIAACAFVRPLRWPAGVRRGQRLVSAVAIAFLGVVAVAPVVSRYRIALAPHTFVLVVSLALITPILSIAVRLVRSIPRVTEWVASPAIRWLVVAGAYVAYAAMLWHFIGAYAGGADSSGYMAAARLLAEHRTTTAVRGIDGVPEGLVPRDAVEPLGFRQLGNGTMASAYPIGLPAMIAATSALTGWMRGPALVIWLHALAGIALTFLLARACGISKGASLLAGAIVGSSPVYLFMSVQLMSDVPALAWTTASVLLAWRSRRDARWAAAAGLVVSQAVLIRPTDILVLVPVAICLGASWRRWVMLVVGAIPGAILLLAYNAATFGHALSTGYANVGEAFGPGFVVSTLRAYATWLPALLSPMVVLALLLPVFARRTPRIAAVLASWALAFLAFYAAYAFTHESWWALRFVLPAFPPLVVAAVWVGSLVVDRWRGTRLDRRIAVIAGTVATLIVVLNAVYWNDLLRPLDAGRQERTYPEVAAWTEANLPRDAVVLANQLSGSLFYYTDLTVLRWDRCETPVLAAVEASLRSAHRPVYAALFSYEVDQDGAFRRIPGRWDAVGHVHDVTVWRLAEPRPLP